MGALAPPNDASALPMARRLRPRQAVGPLPQLPRLGGESRAAEAATVAWLLSALAAALCQIGGGAAWLLRGESMGLKYLAGYLLLAAIVAGVLSLLLLAMVLRWRKVRPPPGLVWGSVIVGVAPLGVVALLQWLSPG
jgi:hypothetical protein